MLAPSSHSTTATQTTSTTATPTRPSRLRGLSYLRLHSRSDAPPLTRAISSPNTSTLGGPDRAPAPQEESIEPSSPPAVTRARASTVSSPTTTPMELTAASTASTSRTEHHPTIRFIPHIETRSARPSLQFSAITKTLKAPAGKIRVGRYTEREQTTSEEEVLPVGFKSKVVSRRHCEFWCTDGQWYVKDVKSSSGTFLNHVRLSSPGAESRAFPVNDGDVIQLGIDFKGGEEVIFRCVKIRIECNRGWQKALNSFNTAAHKNLLRTVAAGKSKRDSDSASVSNQECSICLNPISPLQCLFYAPCSHVWHYKCVRGLVHGPNWPNFLCPNCRFVADLEADVEPPEEEDYDVDSVHEDDTALLESADQANDASAAVTGAPSIQPQTDTSPESTSDEATSSAVRDPVTPPRSRMVPIMKHNAPDSLAPSSSTPGSNAQFALAVGMIADGLLTPRNDAGPFVFDGSAGRVDRALRDEEVESSTRREG